MGLVQREFEAAGLCTILLTPIPALAQAVGAPRTAAIEYPFGQTLGRPGDADGQRAVLGATLRSLETIATPGEVVHLPFEWRGEPKAPEPPEPPPIVRHLITHPWHLPRLLKRDVPG